MWKYSEQWWQVVSAISSVMMQFCGSPYSKLPLVYDTFASLSRVVPQDMESSGGLWGAAGWGLIVIAHSQQFGNDICLSFPRCYGCFSLLHLHFSGSSSNITWLMFLRSAGISLWAPQEGPGSVQATSCGLGGLVKTCSHPHPTRGPQLPALDQPWRKQAVRIAPSGAPEVSLSRCPQPQPSSTRRRWLRRPLATSRASASTLRCPSWT